MQENIELAQYTTFHIGGNARYFATVSDEASLSKAAAFAREQQLPVFVLGGGSNVLVSDAGFSGVVIKNEIQGREIILEDDDAVLVRCGAGEGWDEVVAWAVAQGLGGIENLSCIPGTVGGAVVQNIGAYGVEIGDLVSNIETYNPATHQVESFTADQIQFSYRHSGFKDEALRSHIVTYVTLRLSRTAPLSIEYPDLQQYETPIASYQDVREALKKIRGGKFPDWSTIGTAGSFFKNPIVTNDAYKTLQQQYPALPGYSVGSSHTKIPLGWVLDKVCGLRGHTDGAVGSYQKQALVLVNYGGATADDVVAFADMVARTVLQKTGICIEWEVTRIEQ